MSRSLIAVPALIALFAFPIPADAQQAAQEESGTHTVVRGETLWDLSRTYFGDPFNWRALHEANEDIVANPHWIYPGQVLTIPGLPPRRAQVAEVRDPSEVSGVAVQVADRALDGEGGSEMTLAEQLASERTLFYRDDATRISGGGVISGEDAAWLAVPRDIFYSAGWLGPLERAPEHIATIEAFEQNARVRANPPRRAAQGFESVVIRFTGGERPGVGDRLLSFRVERSSEHGSVLVPSGVLTVHRMESGGGVAVVTTEYNQVHIGDFMVPAPNFPLEPGVHPEEVSDGMTARVLDFQRQRDLHGPGDIVFLDRGERAGVSIGDEFIASLSPRSEWSGRTAGRLQIVGVRENTSSARIIELDGPIFEKDMTVRLVGKMPGSGTVSASDGS